MTTSITLSPDLQEIVEREAEARGLSVPEFLRETLERALCQTAAEDPMFADDAVYLGESPADLAARHDEYLYGENQP